MTKKELKKQTTKKVLNYLIEEFDIYMIDREAQYFDFYTDYKSNRYRLQMDTRGYHITGFDSMKLAGDGWSQEEIDRQKFAVELEDVMNERVRKLVAS